jgi:LuxR family maltose regulon positive regulatory protein
MRASVLERLCGPLCDAALQRSGSAEDLADLVRADLFVIPVDSRGWFRCHRLFRDALRSRLEPSVASGVLGRAADWFLAQGQVDDAVRHRLAAGDQEGAAALLRSSVSWFLEHGALGSCLQLGERLDPVVAHRDARLCVAQAWAAGLSGRFARMGPWLDAADALLLGDAGPPLDGWHSIRGAATAMRAVQRLGAAADSAVACAQAAVGLEVDRSRSGYVLSRLFLGSALLMADRAPESLPLLDDAVSCARELRLPPLLALQPACNLALALIESGRLDDARRLCAEVAPSMREIERTWGEAAVAGTARLRLVEGRLALEAGDIAGAQRLLRLAVAASRSWGWPSLVVMALVALATAELAGHEATEARNAVARAREVADAEPVWPLMLRRLEDVEARVAVDRGRVLRRSGALAEELTDRELSIVRMLGGTASQREIGAALHLSINTVKGYAKSLYRKLDVATRQDAVARARELRLI